MTTYEQAQRYLAAIPPSVSGQHGHDQAFLAARALKWGFNLSDQEAMTLFQQWNQACQPPWSQQELDHKMREADAKPFDKPRGYLLSGRPQRPASIQAAMQSTPRKEILPTLNYDLSEAKTFLLPDGLSSGFERVLRSCFLPGEGVRVMHGLTEDGLVGCDSRGGVVLSREEWIAKLDEVGSVNSMYHRMGGPQPGVYLGINPMKQDGRGRDSDVTAYRHTLLEFDQISLEEQWLLYHKSELPCAAIIYSGNKSLHAWVKIDAKTRQEYDERVNLLYNHFSQYRPDPKNKNPARFSRCPDAQRGDGWQLLLALNTGRETWTEWSRHLLVQGIGTTYTSVEIRKYNPAADTATIVGNNYLRKGGSCLLVGPSGIGKSSLGMQFAIQWSLGRDCFGIQPVKPLKVLMIQAENDIADLHDMHMGILNATGIIEDPDLCAILDKNFVCNHNVADTGNKFIVSLQRLIDHHEPDLVIVDPLLSFIGDDISKQEVVGRFCRNWLNPMLSGSQVSFMAIHHTGKPPAQVPGQKSKKPVKTLSEWAYLGIGSSELTNWARAIQILNPVGNYQFELLLAKRGMRALAKHPNGMHTTTIMLEHSRTDIYWEQKDPPIEPVTATDTPSATLKKETIATKVNKVVTANLHEFLAKIPPDGERHKELLTRLGDFAANNLGVNLCGRGDKQTIVDKLIESGKLNKRDTLYIKGPQG